MESRRYGAMDSLCLLRNSLRRDFVYCRGTNYIANVDNRDSHAVRDALLRIPNMNMTGRLPTVALVHIKMKIRLVLSVCPCQAPVDTIGAIKNIDLDPTDCVRWQNQQKTRNKNDCDVAYAAHIVGATAGNKSRY